MKKRSESNIASWATASIQVLRIWYVSLTAFGLLDLCLKFFWLKHEQKWPIDVGTRIYHRPTDPEGGKLEANLTSRNTKQWTFLYRESDFQRWNVFSICVFSLNVKSADLTSTLQRHFLAVLTQPEAGVGGWRNLQMVRQHQQGSHAWIGVATVWWQDCDCILVGSWEKNWKLTLSFGPLCKLWRSLDFEARYLPFAFVAEVLYT